MILDYLERARNGCPTSQDWLIVYFLRTIDFYVDKYGGERDPDELRSVLQLELVQTIRTRLGRMYNDDIVRLVGARLYYRSLHHLRDERNRMPNTTSLGLYEDEGQDEVQTEDLIEAVCTNAKEIEVIHRLMQGYTIEEVADVMRMGRTTVFLIKKRIRLRLLEHLKDD